MATLLIVFGIFLLLICSAFFSGSETALMAASRGRLHEMEKEGNKTAALVNKLIDKPDSLLSTILLGNNLVNIGASALATGLLIKLFGDSGIVLATFTMTILVLIFSEVIPKTFAARKPEALSTWVAKPMTALVFVLSPLTKIIAAFSRFLLSLVGVDPEENNNFATEDLRGAIGLGLKEDVLNSHEHRMLDSILDLEGVTVEDIMVHRSSIHFLNVNDNVDDIFKIIVKSGHSRLPVWEENPDNIIGVLHVKDFFAAYHKTNKAKVNVREIMHPTYFVPETVSIAHQLLEFRNRKKHLALVVDEYGNLVGLVTLEDILEEIVGEIEDEHDNGKENYSQQEDGSIVIDAHFPIRDANREFNWKLPEEDAVTLAGLVVHEAQKIPSVGEEVKINKITFKVVAKRNQSITKVEVRA